MKVLVVFDHPRRDSFCGAVLDAFAGGLSEAGHRAEIADLHRECFDPRMTPADEPDWDDDAKRYSDAVLAEQARIARNEALAFVFPVWWWSVPAMTKGWIDRVWNNGWAYGTRKLPHAGALLIGTGSSDAAGFAKRGYDSAMDVQLVTGVMNYCGIPKAELRLLCDVTGSGARRADYLAEARRLGRGYEDWLRR
jgi:NAD(P)H dehydrogenase (quinone)